MMTDNKFDVADRVRRVPFAGMNEPDRFGNVSEVYFGMPNGQGKADMFYAVLWDDSGQVERGYMRCGLELIYDAIGTFCVPGRQS